MDIKFNLNIVIQLPKVDNNHNDNNINNKFNYNNSNYSNC